MDETANPADVRERMWEKLSKSPFVMVSLTGVDQHAEPMTAILDEDASSKFWFYTRRDNRVAPGGPAMAQFTSKDHKVFACIRGNLTPETDQAVVDKYWSNMVEAWFDGGRNDPNLLMLRFELQDAEIWEGDESLLGKFKMLTGQKISGEEAGRHVETAL
ncbi:pyridoxamine 5'-phosphate oxidase family protein [Sphingomonas sp. AOB5]|uniref:pyridoxamine 5'-phosphate oxidase family protein n=1 Tax=Sphingomonas sp. AOB5 TaxID=3034017 RepID=UPI0023FA05A4|nr:pyridoxamine 5'-phosphate oxidase family protein [Sphingomonas sp. AOB5]MDF7774989.1 pyridoxamine 5'-phosphate oxidase family protein [Sphingomonas sp. AOB5]